MLRPLAGDEADATGRSMEQDSVASLDTIGLADEVLSGEAFEHHRSGLVVGNALGQHHEPFRRNEARLGICAERPAGIRDPVAGFHLGDARANILDDTRALAA